MKTTPKLVRSADRTSVRLPRAASDSSLRLALPPAMSNRAFVRAWAARRAKQVVLHSNAPTGRV
jgi:hypothetical protein